MTARRNAPAVVAAAHGNDGVPALFAADLGAAKRFVELSARHHALHVSPSEQRRDARIRHGTLQDDGRERPGAEARGARETAAAAVRMADGIEGKVVDRYSDVWFISPGLHVAHAKIVDLGAKAGERSEYHVEVIHFLTPESSKSTHLLLGAARFRAARRGSDQIYA